MNITISKAIKHYHRIPLVRWSLYKYKCLWGVGGKGRVQGFKKKLHTHIHLDYFIVEFLSCQKKKTLNSHFFN